jgi:hypothetical protein
VLAFMLAPLVALTLPALSFAQSPPASERPPQIAPGPMRPPLSTTPIIMPEPLRVPTPVTTPVPPLESIALALVLPLSSAVYGGAAEAVQAGFAAAADIAKEKYAVIVHGDGDVRAAFDKARNVGARVVVGPLVRDDLKAITDAGGDLPWTIALNQLDDAPRCRTGSSRLPCQSRARRGSWHGASMTSTHR